MKERFKLYYWPVPFRGNFIRIPLIYSGISFEEATMEEVKVIGKQQASSQKIPGMAPPVLHDIRNNIFINQMPAIVLYLAKQLELCPNDPVKETIGLKVLLDCNDVLSEITNHNGLKMWTYDEWRNFRSIRLAKWISIFEELLIRAKNSYILGTDKLSFADLSVFALFGTITRCMPELKEDLDRFPRVLSLCDKIGRKESISKFFKEQKAQMGNLYCGGDIEKSIRKMIGRDNHG